MRYFPLLLSLFLVTPAFGQGSEKIFETDRAEMLSEEGAGEGPAWHPKLGLLSSGNGGVHLRTDDGRKQMFLPAAGTNGLLFDSQGRLLICQPKYRRVSRVDILTKQVKVLTEQYEGKKYNQPNDITVDSKGRIYFTDPKYGSRDNMDMEDADGRKIEGVYRIDLDGKVTRLVTHEVDRPNGIVITPDDKYIYIADNNNNNIGVERKLWRFKLNDDGTIDLDSKKSMFDWKDGRGPDGMVLDAKGRIYVAAGLTESNLPNETADEFKGGVYVISPEGTLLDFVAVPRDEVTNCAFGGADLKTLYVTAGGTLWSIRTTTPGQLPWPKTAGD